MVECHQDLHTIKRGNIMDIQRMMLQLQETNSSNQKTHWNKDKAMTTKKTTITIKCPFCVESCGFCGNGWIDSERKSDRLRKMSSRVQSAMQALLKQIIEELLADWPERVEKVTISRTAVKSEAGIKFFKGWHLPYSTHSLDYSLKSVLIDNLSALGVWDE